MNTNRSTFDRQLGMLRDEVVQISDAVEHAITLSVKALQEQDLALAHRVEEADAQVNARRFAAEEHAYQLLALQQPNAKDMRLIVALVSIVTNLERIGDHAAGIARLAIRLDGHPRLEVPPMFGPMAAIGQWLTRNAMTAFVTCDEALAQTVSARDSEIDELHRRAYRFLIDAMTANPAAVEAGTLLLWVSHNLERIGDRASNIAIRVPYLAKGDLVRHPDAMP